MNKSAPGRLPGSPHPWSVAGVCVFLAAATWMVFGQTLRYDFVNFDDDVYVFQNPLIKGGLTPSGILQTFARADVANWHPLTSLSHMLDWQLYGADAGGHHLTNVLLHAATAILLFLVLRQMTAQLWPSAFVAAVFAVHPLRVESVAWVTERKDVLSGLFFMLTLGAYVRYVRHSGSFPRYLLVVFLFALGLMSKPMLVTLPFVLLLLDYWPLRRFGQTSPNGLPVFKRLILEKIPLMVLSAAICAVTILVQHEVIHRAEGVALPLRIGNAVVSYAAYLGQMVWPTGLAVFYPYPTGGLPPGKIIVALLVLGAFSVLAFRWRKKRPCVLVGWLWYLGMLVPVVGLVQVGEQSRADRYTYLPQIGLYLLLTWMVVEGTARWRHRARVFVPAAVLSLAALIVCARAQTRYWRDSESLWTRALACTSDSNALAQSNLGNFMFQKGRLDDAIFHCRKALEIWPDDAGAHNCLGFALLQQGQVDEAISHFQAALNSQPDFAPAHNNLGMALYQTGHVDDAIAHFQYALKLQPDLADTHNNLGAALVRKGEVEAAVVHYQRALQLKPDYAGAANNLAWVLATSPNDSTRNGARAVELAQRANQLSGGGNLVILRTLAAAYAEAGQFPKAVETARQAFELAGAEANKAFADVLQSEIRLYQAGTPLRDSVHTQ